MISPSPSKAPKLIRLTSPSCINKIEQLICVNNLTHTGRLTRSSIKQIDSKTKERSNKMMKEKKGKFDP